ncbi:hypothetical protein [Gynuella sunshinyii]|uniref:Uncharacterized protein n=1 Tax=Gynuella sunshinyii YC6258 TaxID=1445510 RepID=A0A0C5VPW9_9GAMM|nr:hypothetical protein [Gynuella sunshinyii]AJQ95498.1 hypothetical Protein YC6258_03462 [Gynuella sunshinyii YC6258]
MSMSFFLILSLDTPLQTDQINKDINEPYGIRYEQGVDLKSHSGFLPIVHNGVKTGVETYYIPISELEGHLPPEPPIDESQTQVLQLRWGGDMNESIAAIKTAVAISTTYNGMVFDASSNQYVKPAELLMGLEYLQAEM